VLNGTARNAGAAQTEVVSNEATPHLLPDAQPADVLVSHARLEPDVLAPALRPDHEPDLEPAAMCPMCHTSASVARSTIEAGGEWRCVRCGQHWDAARLATVAAYAGWVDERERSAMRDQESDHSEARNGDAPAERPGGRS
jgi:predicted Zn finger-like uncharacterized protein